MIDPKYVELMNLELDGKASTAERETLRRYLEGHAEAASHYADLSRIARRLDAHQLIDAPAEMHPRIIAAVDMAHPPVSETGFLGWLSGAFRVRPGRLLPTFALGLATGVFLLAAIQFGRSGAWEFSRAVDPNLVSGSMAPVPHAPLVGVIHLDAAADGAGGIVQIYTDNDVTVIRAHLETAAPVDWTLDFGSVVSANRMVVPSGSATNFGASLGEVHARHAGTGDYQFVLSGRVDPVDSIVLKVVEDGQVVAERPAAPVN
ncbi:MAG TPA: hypothetical protein VFX92_02375 [Candidatus Krumholzibacteria bacterium]|nr:hypothetical protein [Candidatus Krumholzibacteria bacterium]